MDFFFLLRDACGGPSRLTSDARLPEEYSRRASLQSQSVETRSRYERFVNLNLVKHLIGAAPTTNCPPFKYFLAIFTAEDGTPNSASFTKLFSRLRAATTSSRF